ncbi:MAG: alpha/beta hydrolase [Proteobacteria bacterium]|nr:MAG: alpha/beta hydrolase [Pseudomonadota bacterium]
MMISGMTFAATSSSEEAGTQQGFVKITKERELFVDYVAPKEGENTLIVLNGLTYATIDWDVFVKPLLKRGVGVLRYDMWGQGKTLVKYAPSIAPANYEDQVEDLKKLLTVMNLKGPFNLVGLSYGGGIGLGFAAAYPKDVKNLILMAPYTEPLAGQYNWIMAQIWATRQMFPFNKASDDELYDS